jgi:hypothetical protein
VKLPSAASVTKPVTPPTPTAVVAVRTPTLVPSPCTATTVTPVGGVSFPSTPLAAMSISMFPLAV